ncbi:hemerythrin domain-containing protein [Nocardioides sp. BGMRC 2183]|nr:hemerythrin domain-containing protein [Nocardioides sp. BGMRC 2183]
MSTHHDVVDLILQDHREMERLFERLRKEPDSRPTLVPLLTTLLTAHERAEEAEVYPAAREAGGADDVEHSQQEHLAADEIARRLQDADPGGEEFDTVLAELIDAVQHHLEEEEETVLPGIRERMDADQRVRLGATFLASRAEHLGEQPDDITKQQLEQQAANVDEPVGTRSKEELRQALERDAEI